MAGLVGKILAFALYLGAMIYIGLRSAAGNKTSKDFFLGGRKVGPWVTALSAEASDSSAWLLMGLPGLCYMGGFRETFWTSLGLIVGTYLAWVFIAKRLRRCSIAFGDSITIPEFFTNRLRDRSHVLSIVSVVFIVLFFTIYTASGFVACAKLFRSVFGLPWGVGLLIGFVIILSYTITGGYKAVCTTDFVQGVLIFVAFLLSSLLIVGSLGGLGNAINAVKDFSSEVIAGNFGDTLEKTFRINKKFSPLSALSAFVWCLGYFGMPHVIVRYMGCRSDKELRTARRVGISWMVLSYIGTFIVGTFGTVFLLKSGIILGTDNIPSAAIGIKALGGGTQEAVFSEVMLRLYPAFIAGLFLCAILAAAMSTADSQLLCASSAISQDIWKGIIKPGSSDKTVMTVSRLSVLGVAVVGLILALNPNSSIFSLVAFAWSGFGAVFGPIVILSLYWKGLTSKGAIAGMVSGGALDIAWYFLKNAGIVPALYEILPAFLACLIVAIVVSLIAPQRDIEILSTFDKYRSLSSEARE